MKLQEDFEALFEQINGDEDADPILCGQLAECFQLGLGIANDSKKADFWYKKTVESEAKKQLLFKLGEARHEKAQNVLGGLYAGGYGNIARNDVEAVRWFRLAAEQEYAPAQNNLGDMYKQGTGVPPQGNRM